MDNTLEQKDGTDYIQFIKTSDQATDWMSVAQLTSNGVNLSTADVPATTKDSGSFEEGKPGRNSGTMSTSGKAIDSKGNTSRAGYNILFSLWSNRKTFPVKFAGVVDPDIVIRGRAYITSLNITSEDGQIVSFEAQYKFTGPIYNTAADVPDTFSTTLSFDEDEEATGGGVTVTLAVTDDTVKFEFNTIVTPSGTGCTMSLKSGALELATVDFPSDYLYKPFRFTDSNGVVHTGQFVDHDLLLV